jgi:hypothetical protein
MLSDEMVEKFRKIYQDQFGETLTKEEAYDQGLKLLRMMKVIYRPLPKETKEQS